MYEHQWVTEPGYVGGATFCLTCNMTYSEEEKDSECEDARLEAEKYWTNSKVVDTTSDPFADE